MATLGHRALHRDWLNFIFTVSTLPLSSTKSIRIKQWRIYGNTQSYKSVDGVVSGVDTLGAWIGPLRQCGIVVDNAACGFAD